MRPQPRESLIERIVRRLRERLAQTAGKPDDPEEGPGLAGAGVRSPIKPPPGELQAGAAKEMPDSPET